METDNEIYFYGVNDKYGFMSNFYNTEFENVEGIIFNCSEQYFMYHKCLIFDSDNHKLLKKILIEKSAMNIKKYGRKVKNFDENVWNEKRYDIMLNALKLKFEQNEIIKEKLLKTKPKILYEASKYDKIWGIGFYANDAVNKNKNNFGLNLLGKALMEVRDNF